MPNLTSLLTYNAHDPGTDAQTLIGSRVRGDGYYGRSDGLHTIQYRITGFQGSITIQGSLTELPEDSDWFDLTLENPGEFSIDTTGLISRTALTTTVEYSSATTVNETYNFTGNLMWIRAVITDWTRGTVDFINLRT